VATGKYLVTLRRVRSQPEELDCYILMMETSWSFETSQSSS